MFFLRLSRSPLRRLSLATLLLAVAGAPLGRTQSTTDTQQQDQQTQQQQTQQQQPAQQPAQQQPSTIQPAPAAGGPAADNGVIALPKKKAPEVAPAPAPARPAFKNPVGTPNYTVRVEVPEVTLDVGVLIQKTGQFVPNLKPDNFRVYENGVEQKVIGFKRVEAPITALLLCEFSNNPFTYRFIYDMRNAAWDFAQQLRPQDYVALMTYDMKTTIWLDFTQDKRQLLSAIDSLVIPGFSEYDMFDALNQAEDRLSRIPGRKYIILIGSGRDSFSRLTLDKIYKKVKSTPDVTIYTISTGGALRAMTEGRPGMDNSLRDMDFLQADNELRTFAKYTGGMSFFPRFEGELPEDFGAINAAIRSKYRLIYHPTDAKQDGTYRKLRVELVDDEGRPLRIQDEKHHQLKYEILARDGYRAQPEVE
ncbi:MAG TPA: VWA domain-containing protein [Terracidiphilus sp.]|nr:VWA domain-containing protein [Terracidiphilus sp.]